MELKIIYQDDNTLVVEKPPFLVTFSRNKNKEEESLDKILIQKFPNLKKLREEKRYGIVHRLDKETSGILLVAKNEKSYDFLQRQFKERKVIKKYLALIHGKISPKEREVEVYLARGTKDKRKQKVFSPAEPRAKGKKLRKAVLSYKALRESENFSLLEIEMKTGRKHQIRATFSYLSHPLAGDKLYGSAKNPLPKNLKRIFLHSFYLKIKTSDGKEREFYSPLPEDLKKVIKALK